MPISMDVRFEHVVHIMTDEISLHVSDRSRLSWVDLVDRSACRARPKGYEYKRMVMNSSVL